MVYRVLLGTFLARSEADTVARAIASESGTEAFARRY